MTKSYPANAEALILQWQRGNDSAFDDLWTTWLEDYCRACCSNACRAWNIDEQEAWSMAGLVARKAANTWKPTRGAKFKTYFSCCWRNAVKNYLEMLGREKRRGVTISLEAASEMGDEWETLIEPSSYLDDIRASS